MKKNRKLDKSLHGFSRQKQAVEEIFYGELGMPIGGTKLVDVPGRNGYVYVRLLGNTSELIQAYNQSVPSIFNLAVLVKRVKNSYSIIGRDNAKYSNTASGASGGVIPLPRHGGQHSLNLDLNMGADITWIYSKQFMSNLLYPSGTSTKLIISPAFYEWDGSWKYMNPTGSIELSSYLPTAGNANMVLVWIEGNTGNLMSTVGVAFSGGVTNNWEIAPYIPDIDRNNGIPLMAVRLTTGTTSLDWSNLYDVRDFYTVGKHFNGIAIQDDTVAKGTGTILNFGNNLTVTMAGNVATIDGTSAGGGGGIGFVAWDEGVFLGTGTILNFTGANVQATISGSVVNVFVTGSAGGTANPPITGSIVFLNNGVIKGSALSLDVVSSVADVSISGTVARLFITGSASAASQALGAMNFIQEITPTGNPTGTFSNIPQNYKTLVIFYNARSTANQANVSPYIYYNQDYTASNYRRIIDYGYGGGTAGAEAAADAQLGGIIAGNTAPANSFSIGEITIPYYYNSISNKELHAIGSHRRDTNSVYMIAWNTAHEWFSTNPITNIDIVLSVGNYVTGSVFSLYGIQNNTTTNPPVTGSVVIWDEGSNKGSATTLDFVGGGIDVSLSGTVARIFVTGSAGGVTSFSYPRSSNIDPATDVVITGTVWTIDRADGYDYQHLWFTATGADGDKHSNGFCVSSGTYNVKALYIKDSTYGIVNIKIDNNLVLSLDSYAAVSAPNTYAMSTGIPLNDGYHSITYEVNGKNGSSSGYKMGFQMLWIIPSTYL